MKNQFGIDLQKVINSNASWSINKMLATKLSIHPYFKIGEIFKSLSDDDVVFLRQKIHNMYSEESIDAEESAAELYLMMMLLSIGHELQPESEEMMAQWYDDLCTFIVLETISRSGLAETQYENLVFGGDFTTAPFVKMKDEGLQVIEDLLEENNNG